MRFITLALAALPLPALAETYTVPSAPTAVTVYSGYAMVTREVSVDVDAGAHELILPDLPQWVDAGSLRVSVAGAQLGSTRLRTDALPPQPDRDSEAVAAAKERIETAELALRDLDDKIIDASLAAKAAEARLAFLTGIAAKDDLPAAPETLAQLGEMIEAQTLEATQMQLASQRAARAIAEDRKELEREVEDARASLVALTPPAEPKALLALSVEVETAGSVNATISYPANASWEPTYDLFLETGATDTLTLRRAALIYQRSGENWEDVALTLSTLAPTGQVLPSEIYPPLLRFEDPQEQAKQEMQEMQRSSADVTVGAPAPAMMMESAPQPNFDGPGVSYSLTNPISIARDAEGARVELDALPFDARVFAQAVPARDQTAFRMAEATNESLEPLLAASTVQLFVDGALVGRSSFDTVPAGGEFIQAFGPVEDLRLQYTVLDRSAGDRGLINRSNARTQQVRMTVENLGDTLWDVELLEAIPYSEQDDLLIEWEATPAATAQNVQDRRGLMQWDFSLAAGATQDITVDQVIRWPDSMVLR